jgi:hypothetical protein
VADLLASFRFFIFVVRPVDLVYLSIGEPKIFLLVMSHDLASFQIVLLETLAGIVMTSAALDMAGCSLFSLPGRRWAD